MKKTRSSYRTRFCFLVTTMLAAIPLGAQAQTTQTWYEQQQLTGNWGGMRTTLLNEGIKTHFNLTSQFGGVVSGGKEQGHDYAQQLTAGLDFDLDKLIGLRGGTFHFYVNDRIGRNISSDFVGSKFSNFGIYGAGENFRLINASYEQNLFHDRLNFLVGYYPLGNEFANTPALCGLTANAFCAHAQFFPNASGWLDAPTASWGGRVKYNITPSLYIETGAFESNPLLAKHSNYGWHLGLQGATGTEIPLEIGKTVFVGPDRLVGHYKIGGYYDTSEVTDVLYQKIKRRGRYGGYILVDQDVYNLDKTGKRNVTLFAQAMMGDKRTAYIESWFTLAMVVKGPFSSRPNDRVSLGWAKANVNSRALDGAYEKLYENQIDNETLYSAEQLVELSYNIAVLPSIYLTPDVQYDIKPGAFSYKKYPNAWILSTQLKVNF